MDVYGGFVIILLIANRKEVFVTGEYYHVYNRGVDKRDIFSDEDDVDRFLEGLCIFNQTDPIQSIQRYREINGESVDVGRLRNSDELVQIVSYSLLPNHFHILLKQKVDGGISEFMKRIGGYTKYFNDKYDRSGALFQGKFKARHCANDLYLKLIFCYTTFNFKIHNISKERMKFVRSSWTEYVSEKFYFVSPREAKFILMLFGSQDKIQKYAKDVISIIRKKRDQTEIDDNDFEIK